MAGLGAAMNTGESAAATASPSSAAAVSATRPSREPCSPARRTVIAVDVDHRKLDWAQEFGATHTVNSGETDPVEAIRELTGGFGADVVIDAVGPAGDLRAGVLRA